MKLTTEKLKKLIKEELDNLEEAGADDLNAPEESFGEASTELKMHISKLIKKYKIASRMSGGVNKLKDELAATLDLKKGVHSQGSSADSGKIYDTGISKE